MTFSENELRSYLDGEAPDGLAQQIEAALAQDPALEDRLMRLDAIAPLIQHGLAHLPSPSGVQITAWTNQHPPRTQSWSWLAAGVLIGALLVGTASWMTRPQAPGWRDAVASYQALYSKDTVAKLDFTQAELNQQIAEAEGSIDATDLQALVTDLDGLRLIRSQVLAHDGRPLVQIVFATDQGEPVALCLMQARTKQSASIAEVTPREGLSSLAFDTQTHSWLLIGTQDEALIRAAGEQLRTRLGIDA